MLVSATTLFLSVEAEISAWQDTKRASDTKFRKGAQNIAFQLDQLSFNAVADIGETLTSAIVVGQADPKTL